MKPRVLVTNDDGIQAPGLRCLVAHLCEDSDLLVVAPERQQSAVGHSITLHKPLRMDLTPLAGLPVRAFQSNGTPADCVVLGALSHTGPVDLVVSGINAGANLGEEVFYSGTVSAALEAAIQGIPAFAISLADKENGSFEPAARLARRLVGFVLELGLPRGTLLNVNVPGLPLERQAPPVVTRLGRRCYANQIEERKDPWGRSYFWFSGEPEEVDSGPGTDIGAVAEGRTSITPMHTDLSDYSLVEKLRAQQDGLAARLMETVGDGNREGW